MLPSVFMLSNSVSPTFPKSFFSEISLERFSGKAVIMNTGRGDKVVRMSCVAGPHGIGGWGERVSLIYVKGMSFYIEGNPNLQWGFLVWWE